MKITNKLGLPEPLVAAIRNDPYNKGDADYSVTQLIAPARQVALKRQHWDDIEEDASDRLWALLGQIGHLILERASKGEIIEKRFFMTRGGVKVSGQADIVVPDMLVDYKITSAWSVKDGLKREWEQQVNLLAVIMPANISTGIPEPWIKQAQIVAILRDWSKLEAKRNADYPQAQVQVFDVPLWEPAKQLAFLDERIAAHERAKVELPQCTPEETWERPTKYALTRRIGGKATRLVDTLEKAEAMANAADLFVEVRPGERPRCESYCPVAHKFCDQYKQWKEQHDTTEAV